MWGQSWGQMIWGKGSLAAVQIPFGPWTLLCLGFVLGICAVYANRSRMARIVPFVMVLLVPVVSVIAVNIPNVFQNGTIADADQVNENFSVLNAELPLETSISGNVSRPVVAPIDHTKLTQLCTDPGGCSVRLCTEIPSANESGIDALCTDFWFRYQAFNSVWALRLKLASAGKSSGTDGNSNVFGFTSADDKCAFTDADSWSLTSGFRDNNVGMSVSNTSLSASYQCAVTISD